jgi:hypothetical protein
MSIFLLLKKKRRKILNQIITEFNVFEGDSEGMSSLNNSLSYKNIINDPIEYRSGVFVLTAEEYSSNSEYKVPNKLILDNINFINILGSKVFTIVVNDKIAIYTKQFSFMNLEEIIKLIIVPRYIGQTTVKYNYGYLKSASIDSPIYSLEADIKYDEVLEDLIISQRAIPDTNLFRILSKDLNFIPPYYDSILETLISDDRIPHV